ncbi:hypothetical protein CMV30_18380 [Nibricoccus aquaticus]|uniref:Uncharacterized protein n=1 Tax=Nibricoccus aquaticus TaxID=2576891 RepID=A0A290QBX7_9BACT|nr:hypothetical protein [Nibricoccus aquaticus]ATC65757.1 hypothetical protein CMV30_18380 [Nibricoccus aquaticus]
MNEKNNWLHRAHWSVYAAFWILGLVLIGTILGMICFPLGGLIVGAKRTSLELLIRGARFGSFYFLIWAPAVALTACVMRAYRRRHPDAETPQSSARSPENA